MGGRRVVGSDHGSYVDITQVVSISGGSVMPFISKDEYARLVRLSTLGQTVSDTISGLRARVEELKEELRLARDRCDREQMRADSSLHSMVRNSTGYDVPAAPVAPSTADVDPFAEDSNVVEEMREIIRKQGAAQLLEQSRTG